MLRRRLLAPFLAALCLLSAPAFAGSKVIAVLPLDVTHTKGKLDADARASIEEMLRDVAVEALGNQGWTVLTGENMLQVLQDNGVDSAKCGDQSCHLSMAREIKAEKFLSGAIQWSEGEYTASVRLIDTATGRILASVRLEGETARSLRKAFEAKSDGFFKQGGLLAAPAPPPLPVLPTPPPAPVLAPVTPPPAAAPLAPAAQQAAPAGCDSTCQILTKACNEGDQKNCYALAGAYKYGLFGLSKDTAKADTLYRGAVPVLERSCSTTEVNDCLTLSNMYQTGDGVPKDEVKSTALAHSACEKDSAPGCMMCFSHNEQSYAIGRLRVLCDKSDNTACSYLTVDAGQKAHAIEVLKARCESTDKGACPYYEVNTKH
jgi:hypothetical protein